MSANSPPIEPRGAFVSGCLTGPVDVACRQVARRLRPLLRPGMMRRLEICRWGSPDGRFDAWLAMGWGRVMPVYVSPDHVQASRVEQFAVDYALDHTVRWSDTLDIGRYAPRGSGGLNPDPAPAHYVYFAMSRRRRLNWPIRRIGRAS